MADKLSFFSLDVSDLPIPERFTFPFYYDPHPLALAATRELQSYLQIQTDFSHNFGLIEGQEGIVIGKMFGVLVVSTSAGELGYLAAFSGKLADSNEHRRFVPPVYDVLVDGDFYREGEAAVMALTHEIERLESDQSYLYNQQEVSHLKEIRARSIKEWKDFSKNRKKARASRRSEIPDDPQLERELSAQSLFFHYTQRDLISFWDQKLEILEQYSLEHEKKLKELKQRRKRTSIDLQQRIFSQYTFLNASMQSKSLRDIFQTDIYGDPPAGSGECAAPKLLQYAYEHQLRPLALAEFWWGASPKSEVRRHAHYYPSCRGKCEPILGHMLQGLTMDDNPLHEAPEISSEIEVLYEDDHLAVISKPAGLLSQPGKTIKDCIQRRMRERYPSATGPLIVHRLDMSTSGLMLIAKSKKIHATLQRQFVSKTIKKRYVAILSSIISEPGGTIDLPLRVDLDDRPRQLVCHEHGKSARTIWKKVSTSGGKTRVHFYPITGRTHQLRVHAAHSDGLSTPIEGDGLYGARADRLYLHAAEMTLIHPVTSEPLTIVQEPPF